MATLEDTFLEDLEDSDGELPLTTGATTNNITINNFQSNMDIDEDERKNIDFSSNNKNIDNNKNNDIIKEEEEDDDDDDDGMIGNEKMNEQLIEINKEEDIFEDMENIIDIDKIEHQNEPLISGPSVESVSDLLNSHRLKLHLQRINQRLQSLANNNNTNHHNSNNNNNNNNDSVSEEKYDYDLIVESNRLITEIDNHIFRIHKFIKDIYATKFPELEEMVQHPIEYAKCIKCIANKTPEEMNDIPLKSILSNSSIAMMINVTASTTTGKQLSYNDLVRVLHASDVIIELEKEKNKILSFVSSRMNIIAPNTSNLIGSELTAKLISYVGGIKQLSNIPSCNIQVLGSIKKLSSSVGYYNNIIDPHLGILASCELIRNCPKELKIKALRLLSGKVVLCARCDAYQNNSNSNNNNNSANPSTNNNNNNNNNNNYNNNGINGIKYKELIYKKIEKWQEPPPPKPLRPLTIPDNKPKKKRGGKRYRKMRERYKPTETQRMQNRMSFNKPEEEIIDGNGEIIGLGMLGNAADVGGRLRAIQPKLLNSNLHKIHKRQILKQKRARMKAEKAGTVSGLHTSLSFTPIQGIELSNPELIKNNNTINNINNKWNKYFNEDDVFAKKQ